VCTNARVYHALNTGKDARLSIASGLLTITASELVAYGDESADVMTDGLRLSPTRCMMAFAQTKAHFGRIRPSFIQCHYHIKHVFSLAVK